MFGVGLAGVVKSWNSAKGYGFINSEGLGIEGDVLFTWQELPPDAQEVRGSFLQGRPVTFEAEERPDGRVKATSVQIIAVEGQPVAGSIKSYNEKNGYGFVTSSSLPADVRFHRQDIPLVAPGANLIGSLVTFVPVALTDGKLRVSNIMFQSKQTAEKMNVMNVMTIPKIQKGAPMLRVPVVQQLHQQGFGMAKAPQLGGKAITGQVKSFSDKNGYGFIRTPQNPNLDIKFGRNDVPGGTITVGAQVTFLVAVGPDGRAQARSVTLQGQGPLHGQGLKRTFMADDGGSWGAGALALKHQRMGTSSRGIVKSYNATKGFGFIESSNGDIYFMKQTLPAHVQEMDLQGQVLEYELATAPDGKLRATSVSLA